MDDILATLDFNEPYPGELAEGPRGRLGGQKRTALPEHWLESRELQGVQASTLLEAELSVSGG